MITLLTVILLGSLILFVASLVVAIRQGTTTNKTYQYLISETLGSSTQHVQNSFGRAARRPTRVLGTFIF